MQESKVFIRLRLFIVRQLRALAAWIEPPPPPPPPPPPVIRPIFKVGAVVEHVSTGRIGEVLEVSPDQTKISVGHYGGPDAHDVDTLMYKASAYVKPKPQRHW